MPQDKINGQVMILASMALGGALLGISALAGLLMTYQIRQTTDLTNSTKAIMAADSGMEWGLYQYFHPSSPAIATNPSCSSVTDCNTNPGCDSNGGYSLGPYANGAAAVVNCYGLIVNTDGTSCQPELANCSNASSVQSVGLSNNASRAFRAYFRLFAPTP